MRPLLDTAASIGTQYQTGGLLLLETVAAGLTNGQQLWFGSDRNVGTRMAEIAEALDILIKLAGPAEAMDS